jgi:hypothetical protein
VWRGSAGGKFFRQAHLFGRWTALEQMPHLIPTGFGASLIIGELAQRGDDALSRPRSGANRLAQRPVVVADVVDSLAMAAEEHPAKSLQAMMRQ